MKFIFFKMFVLAVGVYKMFFLLFQKRIFTEYLNPIAFKSFYQDLLDFILMIGLQLITS